MSHLMRATVAVIATAAMPLGVLGTASAAPAQHATFEESFSGTEPISAEENPCGRWAGSFYEARTGTYKILAAPGGQVEGEYHVNGVVAGQVVLTPSDPNLPTYSGSYREKTNAVITGYDEVQDDDLFRNARYALRAVLTGTDGSRLVLALSGKLTVNAGGVVTVDRQVETCG